MERKDHKPIKLLEGKSLYLRPLEMSDERECRRWLCDESTRTNLAVYWPISEALERQYIEKACSDETHLPLTIVLNTGDRAIGVISLRNIRWKDRTAELGLTIGEPDSRGKGYGTEASRLILKYAFHTLNLHRIQLGVWEFNTSAIRLYERIGFVREGNQRQHGFINGRYVDHYVYAILDSEFAAAEFASRPAGVSEAR